MGKKTSLDELPTARPTGAVEEPESPETEEILYFHLKDNVHEFKIGLWDILACLQFASDQGDIPKIPSEWIQQFKYSALTKR